MPSLHQKLTIGGVYPQIGFEAALNLKPPSKMVKWFRSTEWAWQQPSKKKLAIGNASVALASAHNDNLADHPLP